MDCHMKRDNLKDYGSVNNQTAYIGYTVSYIFNATDRRNIDPQFYYTGSVNLEVVTFNPSI
jgi:hypothetical protein